MPNVLVFESDAAFAAELAGEFKKHGCAVTVVDDASVGLQTAASQKPDLILLTIELPRMNGFSVCNKLKRDPALKEVPLIILSSDSTEETFEQHRRLRTHAEDYVHKPVTFADLLPRITKFVSLSDSAPASSEVDDIVIDEEIDFEETQGSSAPAPSTEDEAAPTSKVDKEVDDFAESAFGAIMDKGAGSSAPAEDVDSLDLDAESLPPSRQPSAPSPGQRASTAPRPRADSIDSAIKEEVARQAERIRDLEKDLREARSKATELEDAAKRTAGKDPEVQKLKRELDETKAKLAGGAKPGGGSARDYLDLREALNKKDKELLDLRDQLSHKDKELFALRDTNLGFEREKADLQDQMLELERQVGELGRQLEGARADKDQAAKRADDFKRKAEKVQSELDARSQELVAVQKKHEEESATRDAREAALRLEHTEALERADEVKVAAVAAAEDRGRTETQKALEDAIAAADQQRDLDLAEARELAKKEREQAVTQREGELKKEHDSKLAALHRANEESLNRLKAEHSQALVEADKAATARFEAEKGKLLGEHDAKVAELEGAHGETLDKLRSAEGSLEQLTEEKVQGEASRDARIAALEKESGEKGRDIEAAKRTVEELDARLAAAEANLAATREELRDSIASLGSERMKTDKATAKWTGDKASLERAKDALAAALAQLDEIESRPLE